LITLEKVQERAESDARTHGYYLNPDPGFLHSLLEGLKENEARFGYPSCPCRFASGNFDLDRDIICARARTIESFLRIDYNPNWSPRLVRTHQPVEMSPAQPHFYIFFIAMWRNLFPLFRTFTYLMSDV